MLLSTIFATIFLANNLYPTSASPMLFEGSVTGGESLNLRTNSVAPEDQKCPQVSQWHGRVCHPEQGDRAWEDICRHEGLYTYYMRPGMCPEDTMCQTIMNVPNEPDPRDTISCVPRATNRNQLDPNRQIGVYMVQGSSAGPAQRRVSVKLETDLAGASVSALLEGSAQNYVIAANAAIVGSLHDTTTKLCNYNVTTRNCVPTGQHSLTTGDTIDFDFGLGRGQIVRLYYAIFGS